MRETREQGSTRDATMATVRNPSGSPPTTTRKQPYVTHQGLLQSSCVRREGVARLLLPHWGDHHKFSRGRPTADARAYNVSKTRRKLSLVIEDEEGRQPQGGGREEQRGKEKNRGEGTEPKRNQRRQPEDKTESDKNVRTNKAPEAASPPPNHSKRKGEREERWVRKASKIEVAQTRRPSL